MCGLVTAEVMCIQIAMLNIQLKTNNFGISGEEKFLRIKMFEIYEKLFYTDSIILDLITYLIL